MDENRTNRMHEPSRRRGPAPQSADTPSEAPAEHVEVVHSIPGIRCPACGRGMVPRRDRVANGKSYARCTLCPARMVLTFDASGKIATVRLV